MSGSAAFRSHLLQQFAAEARRSSQASSARSTPPLALVGILGKGGSSRNNVTSLRGRNDDDSPVTGGGTRETTPAAGGATGATRLTAATLLRCQSSPLRSSATPASHPHHRGISESGVAQDIEPRTSASSKSVAVVARSSKATRSGRRSSSPLAAIDSRTTTSEDCVDTLQIRRHEVRHHSRTSISATNTGGSSATLFHDNATVFVSQSTGDAMATERQASPSPSANQFQSVLRTRRTTSHFEPTFNDDLVATEDDGRLEHLRCAIIRGVECATSAPNHKRTEPWTFKTMIVPSPSRTALLDMVYEITYRNKGGDERSATSKRDRWGRVPAFVAVLAGNQPNQVDVPHFSDADDYRELPFVPPATLRQVEDYAATCAAIQNFLLSLHSEGYGTKWSTGSITRTLGFRKLIQAREDDLVAGLVLVGVPKVRIPRRRRNSTIAANGGDDGLDLELVSGRDGGTESANFAGALGGGAVVGRIRRGRREFNGDVMQDL